MEATAAPRPGKRNQGQAPGPRRMKAQAARAQGTGTEGARTEGAGTTPPEAAPRAAGRGARSQNSAARIIGHTIWEHDFDSANPEATAEERKQGWAAARARYMRLGKQVQGRLRRRGLLAGPAGGDAAED